MWLSIKHNAIFMKEKDYHVLKFGFQGGGGTAVGFVDLPFYTFIPFFAAHPVSFGWFRQACVPK